MKKLTALIFIGIAALSSLTACNKVITNQHMIEDQNKQYTRAQDLPPLQIPANLKPADFDKDQTKLPPASSTGAITPEPPLPPGSLAQQVASGEAPASVLKQKLPSP